MATTKEKVTALKSKLQSTNPKSKLVNKVLDSDKKNPNSGDFQYWQANNDIGRGSDKPWGQ